MSYRSRIRVSQDYHKSHVRLLIRLYAQTWILVNLIVVKFLLCLSVLGLCSMLPGVYMVKIDMLNPNLTSKITQNLNQSQKHLKKTDFQTFNKISCSLLLAFWSVVWSDLDGNLTEFFLGVSSIQFRDENSYSYTL